MRGPVKDEQRGGGGDMEVLRYRVMFIDEDEGDEGRYIRVVKNYGRGGVRESKVRERRRSSCLVV